MPIQVSRSAGLDGKEKILSHQSHNSTRTSFSRQKNQKRKRHNEALCCGIKFEASWIKILPRSRSSLGPECIVSVYI